MSISRSLPPPERQIVILFYRGLNFYLRTLLLLDYIRSSGLQATAMHFKQGISTIQLTRSLSFQSLKAFFSWSRMSSMKLQTMSQPLLLETSHCQLLSRYQMPAHQYSTNLMTLRQSSYKSIKAKPSLRMCIPTRWAWSLQAILQMLISWELLILGLTRSLNDRFRLYFSKLLETELLVIITFSFELQNIFQQLFRRTDTQLYLLRVTHYFQLGQSTSGGYRSISLMFSLSSSDCTGNSLNLSSQGTNKFYLGLQRTEVMAGRLTRSWDRLCFLAQLQSQRSPQVMQSVSQGQCWMTLRRTLTISSRLRVLLGSIMPMSLKRCSWVSTALIPSSLNLCRRISPSWEYLMTRVTRASRSQSLGSSMISILRINYPLIPISFSMMDQLLDLSASAQHQRFLSDGQSDWPFFVINPVVPSLGLQKGVENIEPEPSGSSSQEKVSQKEEESNIIEEKHCFNSVCGRADGLKKIKEAKCKLLCKNCSSLYKQGYFCDHCEQIYDPVVKQVDGKQWIGCELCDRWNHIDCECKENERLEASIEKQPFYCQRCKNRQRLSFKRSVKSPLDENYLYEHPPKKKHVAENKVITTFPKIDIFNHPPEEFIYVQNFLSSCGKKLSLSESQLREDVRDMGLVLARLDKQKSKREEGRRPH